MGPEALTRRTGGRRGGEGGEEKIEGGGGRGGSRTTPSGNRSTPPPRYGNHGEEQGFRGDCRGGYDREGRGGGRGEEVTIADMGVREEADTMMPEITMIIGEMRGQAEVVKEEISEMIAGAAEVEVGDPSEARNRINSSSSSSKRRQQRCSSGEEVFSLASKQWPG